MGRVTLVFTQSGSSSLWLVLILLAAQYALGILDVVFLAPVWLQIAHLLGADLLWAALVVLVARLTLEPVEQRS